MSKVETIAAPRWRFEKFIWLFIAATACGLIANFFPILMLLLIGGALFWYFWKHQDQFVLFLIAYTPFEEIILKLLPDSYYAPARFFWEGMLFGFMLVMIFDKIVLKKNWQKSPIDLPILIFLLGWLLSGLWNHVSLTLSLANIKNLIRYIPLFYVVINLKPDRAYLLKATRLIIIIAVIQSAVCLAEAIDAGVADLFIPKEVVVGGELIRSADVQQGTYYTRFSGTLSRNVHLGSYLAFALCFLAALNLRRSAKRWPKLAMAPILLALFICSSRMSWISAFVGVGTILLIARHKWRVVYFVLPAALLLVVFIIGNIAAKGDLAQDFNILNRFYYIFSSDYMESISSMGRLYAVFYAMPAVFMANPLLGIGPGSFIKISEQMAFDDSFGKAAELGLNPIALNYVHDIGYASLFVQVGLLGLMALIWIFVRLFKLARKTYRDQIASDISSFMLGATGFFAALAIQNLGGFNLMYRNQSLLIWTIAGLVALFARVRISDEERNRPDLAADHS